MKQPHWTVISLSEIIETYWNVNFLIVSDTLRHCFEIIETYWNVNKHE